MLRIMKRDPDRFRMDRVAGYMREFADLLGVENNPVFKGIRKASTGLKVAIPQDRSHYAQARLTEAKTNPESKAAKCLRRIEDMLGEDGIEEAQLLDKSDNVVYLFAGRQVESEHTERIHQEGEVDGMVTGLVGADDTMHLHLRNHMDHDFRLLLRDEALAREILQHFRAGTVRAHVRGSWVRTEYGWVPEANRCTILRFEVLDDAPARSIFSDLARIEGNGWAAMESPMSAWKKLRGIH